MFSTHDLELQYNKMEKTIKLKQKRKESFIRSNWLRINYHSKKLYHCLIINLRNEQTILFIIGCQRSGTSITTQVFELDWNTKVYGETSELSTDDPVGKIRLNAFDKVKATIKNNKVPFVITKPLVETQNILNLLNNFKDSKALWMFRHYKDVASSNLKEFGLKNGINNLRPIVENEPNNWRSENVPDFVRNIVLTYFSEDMLPHDAAALFWFVRNYWFFELQLEKNPRVIMCKYDDMVSKPSETFRSIYKFAGQHYPGDKIVKDIDSSSKGKGKKVELSPEIDKLCRELLYKMNDIYTQKSLEGFQ